MMTQQWQQFLIEQGAVFTEGYVANFGRLEKELDATANGHILVDLSHLGLLQLSREDAASFLQGQLTNDVKLLNGHHSQYTGYCNPKGRLLALFLAFSHHDHIHLQLDRKLVEAIMKRLKMFVMRSKVTISDESSNIVRMGVAGQQSIASLQSIFNTVPENPHQIVSLEQATIVRLPTLTPCFEIFTNAEHASNIWQALSKSHTPAGKACWDWLEIQAGIPEISLATQEAFVPQMINLDALGGINFKKGCYTGQEIVARTHYLGKVKRRTHLAHISSEQAPKAGDVVKGADAQDAGQIVRVAVAPSSGFDALVEIRLESVELGSVTWQNHELVIQPLPYPLT